MLQRLNPNFRFAIIYVGVMIVMAILFWALEKFLEISSNMGSSMALNLATGAIAGQFAARDLGQALPKKRMWRDAFVFTWITLFISLIPVALLVALADAEMLALLANLTRSVGIIALVVGFFLPFLMIRFGYGMGIRNELKRLERLARA